MKNTKNNINDWALKIYDFIEALFEEEEEEEEVLDLTEIVVAVKKLLALNLNWGRIFLNLLLVMDVFQLIHRLLSLIR